MKKSRTVIFTAVLLTMIMLLTSCAGTGGGGAATTPAAGTKAPSGTSAAPSASGSLTVVINGDIGTVDPHDNVNFSHHQVTRQIYETLVVRDQDGNLVPWLAESWDYTDDTTIVFTIRKGVKFHNGEELKASDVLFSLKREKDDNTTGALQVNRIDFDKCEVVGDYKVKIVTDKPYAMQLAMLENPLTAIISQKAYTESGGDFFKAPIGTGPFKFVDYKSGDSIKLVAYDDYWVDGQPYVKDLTFRIITDSSSRAIEAESGGSDIVYDIGANDIARVASNKNVNMVSGMGANTSYVLFNTAKKPLDDIRVREAIWYGLDVAQAIEVAYGSYGAVADGFLSPGIEGRHPDLTPWFVKRDVAKAKQLLADAGYANGLTLTIICENTNQQRMDFSEAAQAQLAEIGLTLNLNFLENNAWASAVINGEAELAIYGLTASTGEGGRILMRWLPTAAEFKACNWKNDEYISTCDTALATIDTEKRKEMFYRCQELLMESRVALPIWHKEINAALKPNVSGFFLMPSYENHYLQYVKLT